MRKCPNTSIRNPQLVTLTNGPDYVGRPGWIDANPHSSTTTIFCDITGGYPREYIVGLDWYKQLVNPDEENLALVYINYGEMQGHYGWGYKQPDKNNLIRFYGLEHPEKLWYTYPSFVDYM